MKQQNLRRITYGLIYGLKMSRIDEVFQMVKPGSIENIEIERIGSSLYEAVRNFNRSIGQKV